MGENNDAKGPEQEKTASDLKPRNGMKEKAKNFGKGITDKIKEAFKNGIKALWKALPLTAKIVILVILVIIILCACIIVVLSDYSVKASNDSISGYYGETTTSSKASEKYKSDGSLTMMTNEDSKNISDSFFEKTEKTNPALNETMSKKYKNGDTTNGGVPLISGALNINDERTLYEHLINAEKYNFNKIKWVKYLRDENKGLLPANEMQLDADTGLQYPKDSKGTSFDTFVNDLTPYLQSWIIPYGMFSGILGNNKINQETESEQFAYQILLNGYHDITMNQYNLQVETEVTSQNVYDIMEYTVQRTYKKKKDGKESCVTKYVVSSGIKYKLKDSCYQDKKKIIEGPTITYDIKYCLETAKMFDRIIQNTYLVHKYDRNVDTPEIYMTREAYSEGKELSEADIIALSDSKFIASDEEGYQKYQESESGSWTGTYKYTVKKGYTQKETRIWRDTLEILSETDRELEVYDVKEYIAPNELSDEEEEYYQGLVDNEYGVKLNLFDLLNSKKEVYTKYIKGDTNFSQNIGYSRAWLTYSFDALKRYVTDTIESGWKYLYGASLGLDIKTKNNSGQNVSGGFSILTDFDASGVAKSMQEVYSQYDLKDYSGNSWNAISYSPSNADYAWNNWKDYVEEVAADYGVDPLWVLAKMAFESGGGKTSGYGTGAAAGPMQIQKSIHLDNSISAYNVKTGKTDTIVMTREALGDDKTNIKIGIMMYANKLKQCGGNPYLAAQSYNYGNIGFVDTYAKRIGKSVDDIKTDVNDVGWVYESMQYHLSQCSKTGGRWGDGYYAYKFALYLEYLKQK